MDLNPEEQDPWHYSLINYRKLCFNLFSNKKYSTTYERCVFSYIMGILFESIIVTVITHFRYLFSKKKRNTFFFFHLHRNVVTVFINWFRSFIHKHFIFHLKTRCDILIVHLSTHTYTNIRTYVRTYVRVSIRVLLKSLNV